MVIAWHLLDAPRSETAFAAALPMRGLDAWRVYLGLPLTGRRGLSMDEVMSRARVDVVANLYEPIAFVRSRSSPPRSARCVPSSGSVTGRSACSADRSAPPSLNWCFSSTT